MKKYFFLLLFPILLHLSVLGQSNAPTNLAASAQNSTSIRLTWTDNISNETGFDIERSTDNRTFTKIADGNANTPSFTVTGLSPATLYYFRVRAKFATGTSNYSNVAFVTTYPVPPVVNTLTATSKGTTSIQLAWTDVVKEGTYFVERRTGQSGNFTRIATSGPGYTDNSVSPGTEYCYRVQYDASYETAGYSNIACATTQQAPPAAPARLAAQAVSSSQINLQWADVSNNETGFQIERASSATAPFTKIADVGANATSYEDKNLSASTQYCYRVRAVNGAGNSGYTDIQCATTQAPPLGAPQNLVAAAASTTQINLSWTGVANITGYQLERSTDGNNWAKIADPANNATSYEDKNLAPNSRYYYRLRAVNGGGPGPYSNVADATTPDTPPAAPARLTATAVTFSQINLQWADLSNNESRFEIERSTDGTSFTKIADVGANATSYEDKNLQPQTRYYYRIRAVNAAGSSGYSNVADATTPVGPPAAPQNLVATAVSITQINLTWTAVPNATNILIERSPNGNDGWTQIASVAGNVTTYEDKNLSQNTRYFYRIRATNTSGNGPYSNVANAITPDAPPAAPARLTAAAALATQINLVWADLSNNESGFEIERSADGNTGWTKIGDAAANATSFQNIGLTPNTRYFYRIRAINAAGQSAYSNVADATTPDVPPAAPANLTATPGSATQINLTWADQSANETGFEVERASSATAPFTKIADLPANTTTYQDQGLTPAATYCYRVRAKNTIGASAYSNVACSATPDVPPAAPARLTATPASPTQINLAWADLSANESGFEVEQSTSATGTFTKIATLPANATTYEVKNLTDATQYCFRVRAVNAAGPSAYTEPACATTPLAPPVTPTGLTAKVSDYDQIQLNWAAVSPKAVTVSIERSTNPNGPFVEIKQVPAAQTNYVDPGLQEFTTYYFRIRATNAAGNSNYSNVASARIEEVVIGVEDEWITQTQVFVENRTLQIRTEWYRSVPAQVQLHSLDGRVQLADNRRVGTTDAWSYSLTQPPSGLYVLAIVADGRLFTKRIILP
ncbi:fibronectin type III domain-containing protein [Spirosoma sp. BT702]|uniref:Fibronectin type III domain-containing protein n=1 Tax=Spirosoma profusum TaxID=2771354 RepID=A0A926XV70_9BACT|nr:fibronectin type III domain-containing protein [Spirosoma profusum]MBD2700809.1 fibronectin type III domain-containing protein [Spirosoma profusum]